MKTSQSNLIEQGKANLTGERILKSLLSGLAAGFSVAFIVGLITWFFDFKGLWLTVGLSVGACIVSSVLFYFFLYRPAPRAVMERIDRAGLDERMITMLELQDDDSYIAARQRADAESVFQTAMKVSGGKLVYTQIPALIIALACAATGLGAAATVVTGLSDAQIIPTGMQLIRGEDVNPAHQKYTITYKVEVEGTDLKEEDKDALANAIRSSFKGELSQTVLWGESTTAVKAVSGAKDKNGNVYFFKGWADGNGNSVISMSHSVTGVQASQEITAVYGMLDYYLDPAFSYYYNPDDKWDDSNSDSSEPNDPSDGEESPPQPGDPGVSPGPPGGSATDPANSIIDGETPYEENFDSYHDDAMGSLGDDSEGRPPELVEVIEGYFGIL